MGKNLRVGILRETKNPPDRRVAVGPEQALELVKKFPNVELLIQSSDNRCFIDKEYKDNGLNVVDNVSDCDILIGVKEVAKSKLIPNKKYLFFSHTAKKQGYNRDLLNKFLDLKIQIMDHEYLTDKNNVRLVAFGRWAGLVGAYNGLIAYGEKHNLYKIKRAKDCFDLNELNNEITKVKLPAIKILITGGGRVAHGAIETLEQVKGIEKVTHSDFLNKTFDYPVYCQIDPWNYTKRTDGTEFNLTHFFEHPYEYESTFLPYTKVTDFFIPCHFWDQRSPVFMTKDDMKAADFNMDVIADVSCDIAGPIPSTVRPSTIADPLYGYNPKTEKETEAFADNSVTVMAVDNLPGELPRNASVDFGTGLVDKVFPSLFGEDTDGIVERASITNLDGKLSDLFSYLQDFADNKE